MQTLQKKFQITFFLNWCNTSDIKFYSKQYLYSCDFESLYTNMNPNHTIDSISTYFLKKTDMFKKTNKTNMSDMNPQKSKRTYPNRSNSINRDNAFLILCQGGPVTCHGDFTETKFNINSQVDIYKISDRIFMYNEI